MVTLVPTMPDVGATVEIVGEATVNAVEFDPLDLA
jgi:hypothetical protein